MQSPFGSISATALLRLRGGVAPSEGKRMQLNVELIEEPQQAVNAMLAAMLEPNAVPGRTRKAHMQLTHDNGGRLLVNGRACCGRLLDRLAADPEEMLRAGERECSCGARFRLIVEFVHA